MFTNSSPSSTDVRGNCDLKCLNVDDVILLMSNLGIKNNQSVISGNVMDGELLSHVHSLDELKEFGLVVPAPVLRRLYAKLESFKTDGVPYKLLVQVRNFIDSLHKFFFYSILLSLGFYIC
jgi:hypothetical protein